MPVLPLLPHPQSSGYGLVRTNRNKGAGRGRGGSSAPGRGAGRVQNPGRGNHNGGRNPGRGQANARAVPNHCVLCNRDTHNLDSCRIIKKLEAQGGDFSSLWRQWDGLKTQSQVSDTSTVAACHAFFASNILSLMAVLSTRQMQLSLVEHIKQPTFQQQ